jgi:molybdenum cofactor biosynthesis enzyme MoaA
MKRLDIKIGFACNNRCDFCAQGDKRGLQERRPLARIAAELRAAAAQGVESVVFTGGEPTLHPELVGAVKAARRAGFSTIQIQSNGRKFAYLDYCREDRKSVV